MDEEELLSTVKDFVRSFRKLYKECASKNELIKEHNTTVHKIYVKIKNGEAKLIKQDIPIAIPKVVKTATTHPINSNKKPFKVIKKRKFTLLKYK
ncbi:hypothetical protein [Acinetobacter baumannii]|nr:hypothetical protein [Acinetobacter bereziniae]